MDDLVPVFDGDDAFKDDFEDEIDAFEDVNDAFGGLVVKDNVLFLTEDVCNDELLDDKGVKVRFDDAFLDENDSFDEDCMLFVDTLLEDDAFDDDFDVAIGCGGGVMAFLDTCFGVVHKAQIILPPSSFAP